MNWNDLLRMSINSLRRRKLRTFLTVLGVLIGTASIVVMISDLVCSSPFIRKWNSREV